MLLMSCSSLNAAISSPDELDGCVLWLDAADTATITVTEGRVSQWSDKSATAAHMIQADAAKRPLTGQLNLNGLNTLYFDGTRWLGGAAVLQQGDDSFSYFALWQRMDENTSARTVFEQADIAAAKGTRAALLTIGNGRTYGFNGQSNDAHTLAPYLPGQWMMSGLEIDGRATRNVSLYSNGDFYLGSINIETQSTGVSGACVGCKVANKAEIMSGYIAEIIVFDRVLSDMDRNAVLYYLQEKWGVDCGYQDYAMLIDFEHDLFPEGWQTNGAAFVTQPVNSTRVNFFKEGDWFVGTYENTKVGSTTIQRDSPTGSVTGTSFVLSNNTIRALVGGGHRFNSGTELQLQLERAVDDDTWQVIRKASGWEGNSMREICWNTHNLMGETVRFRIVDLYGGTWGQIMVDSIRVLDELPPREHVTSFDEGELPEWLTIQRPYDTPQVELTAQNTLRIAMPSRSCDLWQTVNRAPKVLLNTVDDDIFTLETHLVSRAYTNSISWHMSGLILMFEEPDANTFDPVMFGVYAQSGIRVEGPSITAPFNALSGSISDIWLRIEGRMNKFVFSYSTDGVNWEVMRTDEFPGKVLMQTGIFCKEWSGVSAVEVEYDYLSYVAEPAIKGTTILLK